MCVCVCVCVLGDRLSMWAPPSDEESSGVSPVILSLWGRGTRQGESTRQSESNSWSGASEYQDDGGKRGGGSGLLSKSTHGVTTLG